MATTMERPRSGAESSHVRPTATLKQGDPEIARLLDRDRERHNRTLNFIASENYASPAVLQALASHLNVKYAEGYPGGRYYQGVGIVDEIEAIAIERARKLFGAEHANVQPHSGSGANMAAYYGSLQLGDTILGMDLSHGGHLTHGSPVSFSGQQFKIASYKVHPETEYIDYDELAKLARDCKPKMIVAGASAYPRIIDFPRFRKIADSVGALFMADIAHIAGLVAAGVHPSPFPYADIVTSTTHKTLRGPRGGLILCRADLAKGINRALFPGIQGGPTMSAIAAKAVCFQEAGTSEFKLYSKAIVKNSEELARALVKQGFTLLSGGTDNHLLVIKLFDREFTGAAFAVALESVGIIVSKSTVPGETRSPMQTSGVRFGTPSLTARGATEAQMRAVAKIVAQVAENIGDAGKLRALRPEVRAIADQLERI